MPSDKATLPRSERLRALWPDIKELVHPRRGLLAFGMVLMAINRVSGLVLPASTKYLVDDIIGKKHYYLLRPLILAVVGATLIQGVTSFSLTQLLSKAAQRLIAELRRKVQQHVGRLPVSYYDSNKSGVLVSRIMSDVEGVRNLIGTGLVEFVGGLLTAVLALVVLLRLSPLDDRRGAGRRPGIRFGAAQSLRRDAPHFPRARQDQRRSHRTAYRIAGRRARGEGLSCRGCGSGSVFRRRAAAARQRDEEPHRHVADELSAPR